MSLLSVKKDFPALNQEVSGHPLCYLDSAASSLKPQVVIDAITKHYSMDTANVHRGIHTLSARATSYFEATRTHIKKFIKAKEEAEVIFTKGTTDSVNLVAYSFTEAFIKKGDVILISTMEHHSNFVPWQMACERKGARLIEIPITDDGDIDMKAFKDLLVNHPRVKMVSVSAQSNALGTINPIKEMVKLTHLSGGKFFVDAAQIAGHHPIDVQDLGCDFLCFSAHKMFGPTGLGILYGKKELLEEMPPYQGGGAMIKEVSFKKTTFNELPEKFEAGTPHIAGVIAFKAAIEYVESLGLDKIAAHEKELLDYATQKLSNIEGLTIYGNSKNKGAVISFTMEGAHPHDLAMILDEQGVAIRTGHHCTQPLMNRYNVTATARASFAIYNDKSDVDRLVQALIKAKELL